MTETCSQWCLHDESSQLPVLSAWIQFYVGCPIKGQVRKECASHPSCHRTCNSSDPIFCPKICYINGCECPNGTVIDVEKKECVLPSECSPGMLHYIFIRVDMNYISQHS